MTPGGVPVAIFFMALAVGIAPEMIPAGNLNRHDRVAS